MEIMHDSMVARTDVSGGGEARNGGLQGFLTSLFSTLGGVFGSTFQEPHQSVIMASRLEQQQQPTNGFCSSFFPFCCFLAAGVDKCLNVFGF